VGDSLLFITTVAGNPNCWQCGGFSGDGGPATSAELNGPTNVAVDKNGNLFITNIGNHRIREVVAGHSTRLRRIRSGPRLKS
jgi:NHL repeat